MSGVNRTEWTFRHLRNESALKDLFVRFNVVPNVNAHLPYDCACLVGSYLRDDAKILEFIYHMKDMRAYVTDQERKIEWCIYLDNETSWHNSNRIEVCECMIDTRMGMHLSLDTIDDAPRDHSWMGSYLEHQVRIDLWRAMFECEDHCLCKTCEDLRELVSGVRDEMLHIGQTLDIHPGEVNDIARQIMGSLRARVIADARDWKGCPNVSECEVCVPIKLI